MSELFNQKLVSLAQLTTSGEYPRYMRSVGETTHAFISRVTYDGMDGDPDKVQRYAEAMGRGEKLSPVIVAHLHNELMLLKGHHRCAAAAMCGANMISAVVFNAESNSEVDMLAERANDDPQAGIPWTDSVRRMSNMLRCARRSLAVVAK